MFLLRATLACLLATTGAAASLAQDVTATQPAPAAAPATATPAPAAPAAAPATATAAAKPAKVRKICQVETDTGSIMPHTTCHTKEEWAAINAQNQQQVNQMQLHRGGWGHRRPGRFAIDGALGLCNRAPLRNWPRMLGEAGALPIG